MVKLGPLLSLTIFELPITALGTVTSMLSVVSKRVERMPMSCTSPRVVSSMMMMSPTL